MKPSSSQLFALLVLAFAIYDIFFLVIYFTHPRPGAEPLFGDFVAFWSFARFAQTMSVEQIYDLAIVRQFQAALPGGMEGYYPYPYPPIFLLFLWPLGWLEYLPAFGLWAVVTFGAYLAAAAKDGWRGPGLWIALVAPTTLYGFIAGQNGFLTAALIIGGFRVAARRPLLGGIILGGLVFKPQLFILLPLVLLAGRRWRSLAGLALSVASLTALSVLAFGPTIWWRWLQALPTFVTKLAENRQKLGHLMPTVTASLQDAGFSPGAAQAVQAVITVGTVACLCWIFRQGAQDPAPRPLDVAALQVGVFLVTPYGFIYDMPMVGSAVATVFAVSARAGRPWRPGDIPVLLAALVMPVFLYDNATHGLPVAPLILLLLLGVIVRAGRTLPPAAGPYASDGR